jgi:hypothetical protein
MKNQKAEEVMAVEEMTNAADGDEQIVWNIRSKISNKMQKN